MNLLNQPIYYAEYYNLTVSEFNLCSFIFFIVFQVSNLFRNSKSPNYLRAFRAMLNLGRKENVY